MKPKQQKLKSPLKLNITKEIYKNAQIKSPNAEFMQIYKFNPYNF